MQNLKKIKNRLNELKSDNLTQIFIPSLWLDYEKIAEPTKIEVSPLSFFSERIEYIFNQAEKNANNYKNQHNNQNVVYNLFVRYATAFDHNADDSISNSPDSFRETGTFLKSIAILPYIKSLGTNIVYLLPITSVGQFGKKGNIGSPYSIFNPYKLDENLSEPLLKMTVEEEFAAFVEAAHLLEMKVITEFVFRTASLDSEIAISRPDWFYWLKQTNDEFRPPEFTQEVLEEIRSKVEAQDFDNLPAPDYEYIQRFTDTPRDVFVENGQIIGITELGIRVTIPNAFADWPPDDKQPLWTDVTYLKLYNHIDFNYIAYNTIRMYDNDLSKEENENTELWEFIADIIPYYIKQFAIDGVMLDMGHSLPEKLRKEIVKRARISNKDFLFWEENFLITEKSKSEGYDAVVGYLPFDFHVAWKMNQVIKSFAQNLFPIDFFLTAETHNTKRAAAREGGESFSKLVWTVCRFLPSLSFIHNGFELSEKMPVNTGLGFEEWELSNYPASMLPLFSAAELDWLGDNIIAALQKINSIYEQFQDDFEDNLIEHLELNNDSCIGFIRGKILILANISEHQQVLMLSLKEPQKVEKVLYPENIIIANNAQSSQLEIMPYSSVIIEIST